MLSRSLLLAALAAAASSTLVACGDDTNASGDGALSTSTEATTAVGATPNGSTVAQRTTYPLTIASNCGESLTIDAPPRRTVSVNQGSTEVLLSLGLADRIAGAAGWTDRIRPNLADANATVPRLSDTEVSFERILREEPDLVTASFAYGLLGEDPERRARFAKLGVPTYLAPSHCQDRDGDTSGDGPRSKPLEMETIYTEIRQLAQIFDVAPRGETLVADLEQRLAKVRDGVDAKGVSVAFWFANTESPYMAGCCGSPGVMVRAIGAENVFADTHDEWPQIGWETVLERDPDVLVLGDLQRKSQTGDKLADKIRFLKTNPVTRKLTAVREERFVIMNGADMNPSIRTVDGAEKLAAGIAKFGLAG